MVHGPGETAVAQDAANLRLRRFAHEMNSQLGIALMAVSIQQEQVERLGREMHANVDVQLLLDDLREAVTLTSTSLQSGLQLAQDALGRRPRAVGRISRRDLERLIRNVVTTQNNRFPDKEVSCHLSLPAQLALPGESLLWQQVFTNLVSNSLLHGFDGRTEGNISVAVQVLKDGSCSLEYRDDGVGLSESASAHLFDDGFSTKHGQGGFGLGMGIVRQLLEQGPRATIAAPLCAQGAYFHIVCPPLDPGDEADAVAAQAAAARS